MAESKSDARTRPRQADEMQAAMREAVEFRDPSAPTVPRPWKGGRLTPEAAARLVRVEAGLFDWLSATFPAAGSVAELLAAAFGGTAPGFLAGAKPAENPGDVPHAVAAGQLVDAVIRAPEFDTCDRYDKKEYGVRRLSRSLSRSRDLRQLRELLDRAGVGGLLQLPPLRFNVARRYPVPVPLTMLNPPETLGKPAPWEGSDDDAELQLDALEPHTDGKAAEYVQSEVLPYVADHERLPGALPLAGIAARLRELAGHGAEAVGWTSAKVSLEGAASIFDRAAPGSMVQFEDYRGAGKYYVCAPFDDSPHERVMVPMLGEYGYYGPPEMAEDDAELCEEYGTAVDPLRMREAAPGSCNEAVMESFATRKRPARADGHIAMVREGEVLLATFRGYDEEEEQEEQDDEDDDDEDEDDDIEAGEIGSARALDTMAPFVYHAALFDELHDKLRARVTQLLAAWTPLPDVLVGMVSDFVVAPCKLRSVKDFDIARAETMEYDDDDEQEAAVREEREFREAVLGRAGRDAVEQDLTDW